MPPEAVGRKESLGILIVLSLFRCNAVLNADRPVPMETFADFS